MYCCNMHAKNWQNMLSCLFTATYHFSLIKQKWGNWGICGELFPRNWGNVRLNKQIIKCY